MYILVIEYIANFLSILNTIKNLRKKDDNKFVPKYNHSKEIATIIKRGWESANIYYYCKFDPDEHYYYKITNPENPNNEDMPFGNTHILTGYNEIWDSKKNIIKETQLLSKKIQQIIDEFKQIINENLSEQIIDPINLQKVILKKETVHYSPQNDINVYIEGNIINYIYEILIYNKNIREDDISLFKVRRTNANSKTFECWKLQFKEFNPLGYGDENIMKILRIKFLELLKNKDLIDLNDNYKKCQDKLNYIIKNNNFLNGINNIYNEVFLEGKLIKGKCSKCE